MMHELLVIIQPKFSDRLSRCGGGRGGPDSLILLFFFFNLCYARRLGISRIVILAQSTATLLAKVK